MAGNVSQSAAEYESSCMFPYHGVKSILKVKHLLSQTAAMSGKFIWDFNFRWKLMLKPTFESGLYDKSGTSMYLLKRSMSKCFTNVTKTIANLTTYSRKPGDYSGTIIFEIDIMKNSSPLNLKFTFFATFKTKITLLSLSHSLCAQQSYNWNNNKLNNQNICKKVKFDKDLNWLGGLFHDINLKNNGAIVIPRFSTVCR